MKTKGILINTEFDRQYTEYQLNKKWIRKRVRQLYLNHTLKYVKGKAIDFGCGIGELLVRLPKDSIGFEINKATVEYCKAAGLNVRLYQPDIDRYALRDCRPGEFKTFMLSHVLEHLEHPDAILSLILRSCRRLGIERIIIIVPGIKGFRFDHTHRTFINDEYFERFNLSEAEGYAITKKKYFPINISCLGKYFTHHELMVIYNKADSKQ